VRCFPKFEGCKVGWNQRCRTGITECNLALCAFSLLRILLVLAVKESGEGAGGI
jgi:hypothetical protein